MLGGGLHRDLGTGYSEEVGRVSVPHRDLKKMGTPGITVFQAEGSVSQQY